MKTVSLNDKIFEAFDVTPRIQPALPLQNRLFDTQLGSVARGVPPDLNSYSGQRELISAHHDQEKFRTIRKFYF